MTATPAPAPKPSAADVLRARHWNRLPARLEDLNGPHRGTVQLPIHVAWSGMTMFDLDQPKQRMSMYRTVLAEGQADDLVTLLNPDLLMAQWPMLRSLISRAIRDVWEDAFPGLAEAPGRAAA